MTTISPTFRYDDARAAIRFLCDVFGFSEHAIHQRDGVVHHAELKLGDDYIMLGERRDGDGDGGVRDEASTIYVVDEDPDALFARAVKAGAEVVREPVDMDYGSRECAVKDPGGNVWTFGTYRPA
jgi:uncharacterized glyoxalase superfamily protein PhnB